MTPKLTSLDHLVLTVTDLKATLAFYTDILGMKAEPFTMAGDRPRWALHFGNQKINLHEAGQELEPKAGAAAPGTADLCFLSDAPLSDWEEHLTARLVPIEEGPVRRTGARGPILSLYLRDPDDNLIEIARPAD